MDQKIMQDVNTEETKVKKKKILKIRKKDKQIQEKEFNNPIYEGFDQLENQQLDHWESEPKIATVPIKQEKKVKVFHQMPIFHPISTLTRLRSFTEKGMQTRQQTKLKRQLPTIKERNTSSIRQIRLSSVDDPHNSINFPLRKKNFHIRSLTRIDGNKNNFNEDKNQTNRVSKVIFNYCMESEIDENMLAKILQRRRQKKGKSERLEGIEKNKKGENKQRETKAYWKAFQQI